MKKGLIVIFLLLSAVYLHAQEIDSVGIENANRDFQLLISQTLGTKAVVVEAVRADRSAKVVHLKSMGGDQLADTLFYTDIMFSHAGEMKYTIYDERIDTVGPHLLQTVLDNHALLKTYSEVLKTDFKEYNNLFKGYRPNFRVKSVAAYNTRLSELTELKTFQDKYLLYFFKKSDAVSRNENLMQLYAKNYKDVITPYRSRYVSYNIAPMVEDDNAFRSVISQLDELSQVQGCYEQLIDYRQRIDSGRVQIAEQAGKPHADVSRAYETLFRTYDLAPAFWTAADFEAIIPEFEAILAAQHCFLEFIELRKMAATGLINVETAAGKDAEDVYKSYRTLYDSYDLSASFTQPDQFLQKKAYMEEIFEVQDRFVRFLDYRHQVETGLRTIEESCGKEFQDVYKTYMAEYATYDLSASFRSVEQYEHKSAYMDLILYVQSACLRFIELRKQIDINRATILAVTKSQKNTSAAYRKLHASYDLAWPDDADPATCCDKLEKVILEQSAFLEKVKAYNYNLELKNAKKVESIRRVMGL